MFRRGAAATAASSSSTIATPCHRRRVPPSFSSLPVLCRECMQFSLSLPATLPPTAHCLLAPVPLPHFCSFSLSRVCVVTLHATFSTHRPTRREIGNLKSKLSLQRCARCRVHPLPPPPPSLPPPRPSFSRITLDHRWSSRAWHRTRGCVIELGKWNDSARTRAFFVSRPRHFRPFPGQRYSCAFSPFLSN